MNAKEAISIIKSKYPKAVSYKELKYFYVFTVIENQMSMGEFYAVDKKDGSIFQFTPSMDLINFTKAKTIRI